MKNSIPEPRNTAECLTYLRSDEFGMRKVGFSKLVKLVEQKIALLKRAYGVQSSSLSRWQNAISGYSRSPETLLHLASGENRDPVFSALLKSPPAAALELGKPKSWIVDPSGVGISVLFPGDRLIFSNTEKDKRKVQVWQNWYIDPKKTDHAPGRKITQKKSTFDKGVKQELLLEHILKHPVGFLKNSNTLMLYGFKTSNLGRASIDRGGQPTRYFLFQCEREERPKKADGRISGYRTRCHGYPVSEQEISAEFQKHPNLAKRLGL